MKGNVICDMIDFQHLLHQVYGETDPKVKAALAKKVLWNAPEVLLSGWYDRWLIQLRESIEFQLYELAKWVAAYHYDSREMIEYIEYSKGALLYFRNDLRVRQSVVSTLRSMNLVTEAVELERRWMELDQV